MGAGEYEAVFKSMEGELSALAIVQVANTITEVLPDGVHAGVSNASSVIVCQALGQGSATCVSTASEYLMSPGY